MMVILGFLGIILLIIAHEAGHFFAARRSGIEVEEFGVGFPPRAKVLTEKNSTKYTINWLPLGGFVKLKGESDSDTEPGSFGAARLKDKIKVMIAGVVVNFLVAILLFSFIAIIGMPKLTDDQFIVASDTKISRQEVIATFVDEDSPASKAGLKVEDQIISLIDNSGVACIQAEGCGVTEIKNAFDLMNATKNSAGQSITLNVIRENQQLNLDTVLLTEEVVAESKNTDNPKGYLGVLPAEYVERRSTWSAPIVALGVTKQFTVLTFQGLGSIFSGLFRGDTQAASEQVSGIIGVGHVFSSSSFLGPTYALMIIAVISLSLAIMNLLPIPALDGGRLFVTLFYRVINRPLSKETEEKIHGTGFAVLMVLFVLISIVDVKRIL